MSLVVPDGRSERLKVCLIGTYPPRACGIATFTSDLWTWLVEAGADASVIAVTNHPAVYDYPQEVAFEIRQNRLSDYRLAAEYINFSGADVVCLQHEFGIFGGSEGRYILELLRHLRKPVVTTLHTVLPEPEPGYRETLANIAALSDKLIVLNSLAIPMLEEVYGIAPEKVELIHHGVPDVPFIDPEFYKDEYDVEGRLVLMTFGLLSRNKGIENVLEALPDIVEKYPEVVYIVLGATHPEVKRTEGEEYRLWLKRRIRDLGLEDHVIFHDRFVSLDELCQFIGACDIYITPYRSKNQIVSGTLAYAVGMGKAVVSTPYLYAEELLAEGRGRLVEFGDVPQLTETLLDLIEQRAERHQMRKRAYALGREMTWPVIGERYLDLFATMETGARGKQLARASRRRTPTLVMPDPRLDYLMELTDDVGIIQHASWGIPDRRNGYSTDDQARALVVVLMHYNQLRDDSVLPLATRYLSFLYHAQLPEGDFHNFMNYARTFIDERGSDDTLGRTLWGLGATVALGPTPGMRALAREMFEQAVDAIKTDYPRAVAYSICGLHAFLQRYDGAAQIRRKLIELADHLVTLYERNSRPDWQWYEDSLTYGNAKLPEALLLAWQTTGDERYREIGLTTLDFLVEKTWRDGGFDFVGNQGWLQRGGERAIYGQQPIEAGYTATACTLAWEITGEQRYLDLEQAAIEWLLGRNRHGARIYDLSNGGCFDGLDAHGANPNQGAESIICCLLGLLTASRQRERGIESFRVLVAPETDGHLQPRERLALADPVSWTGSTVGTASTIADQ